MKCGSTTCGNYDGTCDGGRILVNAYKLSPCFLAIKKYNMAAVNSNLLALNIVLLQVSENGVISFNEPWKFAHPNRFPTSYYYSRIKDVAAPFWSDNDIRKEGVVRYAAFKRGDSTRGDEILATIDAYLETEFRGAWMILAQWDQVHPYPHGSDDHEGVSEEFLAKVLFHCLWTLKYQWLHCNTPSC